MKVVCDADPFCYGPVGALISIIRELRPFGWDITVLADGTSHELASREPGISCIYCDRTSLREVRDTLNTIGRPDLVISVLGDNLVKAAQELFVPVAYVDPLFWLWPSSMEEHLRSADWYFIDSGFEDEPTRSPAWTVVRNPVLVGPIIDDKTVADKDKSLDILIGYGGMDAHYYHEREDASYAVSITREILSVIPPTTQFLFVAGRRATLSMSRNFPDFQHRFVSLAHEEFLRTLSETKLFLTVPGANAPFEAFARKTPCVFMPPSNYSQVMQLRRLRRLGLASMSISLEELIGTDELIPDDLPESEGVDKVQSSIAAWSLSLELREAFRDRLRDLIASCDTGWKRSQAERQTHYFQHIGGSGVSAIVSVLGQLDGIAR